MSAEVVRAAEVGARVGESPLWLPERGRWLWLDLQGRQVRTHDPEAGEDRVLAEGFDEDLACLARWTDDDALLVTVRGFHRLSLSDGSTELVACPIDLPAGTIFNDGKVDRRGALWIGSSDAAECRPHGRLWRVASGRAAEIARGFVVSNGPAFAPDGSAAYFADTFGRRILRFPLDADGRPSGPAIFATVPEADGFPDGMCVDRDGVLHVGHWDGARIARWSPEGVRLKDIPIPALNVTSIAFGGEGMRTALVTTAAIFPGQIASSEASWDGDPIYLRSSSPGVTEPRLAADWLG